MTVGDYTCSVILARAPNYMHGTVLVTVHFSDVTALHNHPVHFVNEIHKMLDNFVISNPYCLIFFQIR